MVRVRAVTKMAQAMHLDVRGVAKTARVAHWSVQGRGDVASRGAVLLQDCQFSLPAEIFVASWG